jgi:hypothetical protein
MCYFLTVGVEIKPMRNNISWIILAVAIATWGGGVCAQETGRRVISTPTAPNALGPYSQTISW